MLDMQKEAIRERVNACYGYNAIARIQLTQTAPIGFAEGQADFTPAPKRPAEPAPETRAVAQDLTAEVADPDLRRALQALGANILSKSNK